VAAVCVAARAAGLVFHVVGGGSFLDLAWARLGLDPIAGGVQILDGRELPDPLPLHLPTLITQVDRGVVLADVIGVLSKVLPDETEVVVLDRLGDSDEVVEPMPIVMASTYEPGPRTSLFVDPPLTGWHGLVVTNRRLRAECPWDREQTHHSLVRHLVEEAYETVEALGGLPASAPVGPVDLPAYVHVEEELGDLLLQVVFHATLAAEAGVFDVEEVAEHIRRKLVHRHPHVFGEADAADADTVLANWEQIKQDEKGRGSLMDDLPSSLPASARADKLQRRAAAVGFDWDSASPVLAKLGEEVDELRAVEADPERGAHELGDVFFSAVNVARHLGVDAELVLRAANNRFESRFRHVEAAALASGRSLSEHSLEEMDAMWELAKEALAGDGDPER
ncbi:MAG: nucleoside triphosphate pyrophosphohydrolase, partial [Acidimicrobiia bacterium]